MEDLIVTSVLTVLVTSAVVYWVFGRCTKEISSVSSVTLHLSIDEQQRLIKFSPASSITFYKGDLPAKYLADRVRDILVCNPYLTARFRNRSLFSKEVTASYDSNPDKWCLHDYFEVVHDTTISQEMPYADLMTRVNKYLSKVGTKCINRNEVLFKLCLLQLHGDSYAIVLSLNHSLGDGHTFYKLYGMLSQSSSPCALCPERQQGFKEKVEALLDPHFIAFLKSPLVMFGFFYNNLVCSPAKPYVCVVNKGCVEVIKSEYQQQRCPDSPQFLSTNDIITSWFFNFSKCNYGGMVVNFRNRMSGLVDTMAGNCMKSVIFNAKENNRPECIRECLQGIDDSPPRIAGRNSGGSTSPLDALTLNLAAVTNWASFYQDVELPGGTLEQHLPVMSLSHMPLRATLVVFKRNKRDTAVVFWSRSLSRDQIESESMISRVL